jgi:hypothetical protein
MPAAPPDLAAPAPLIIERDCPCIGCRYNLRTSPLDARCPECAKPVLETLRGHADRLAGADRRWLRAITNGIIWLILAYIVPVLFLVAPIPNEPLTTWMTVNCQSLVIVLTPAIFAIVACWRIGTPRPRRERDGDDQPITCWLLRLTAIAWIVPLPFIAGRFFDEPSRYPRFQIHQQQVLELIAWTGLPATFLMFRRLKYVARHIPSPLLLHQCNVIGSQLPLATLIVATMSHGWGDRTPMAFMYVMDSPFPGAGMPWLIVTKLSDLDWLQWNQLQINAEFLLGAWAVLCTLGAFALAVQFLIALIAVRRADADLPADCRRLLLAVENPQ